MSTQQLIEQARKFATVIVDEGPVGGTIVSSLLRELAAELERLERKPLTEETIQTVYREFMLHQDGVTPSGMTRITRAIERAHHIT